MTQLHLLHLDHLDIFEQLQLEEALLRSDEKNWCIINESTTNAIVLGISSNPDELVDIDKAKKNTIPLIRRFSGGGTVFVDNNTIIITFIFMKKDLLLSSSQEVMLWSKKFYQPIFSPYAFNLIENDYVIEKKKCGGNAQYIKKTKWLHHTSFLWDYKNEHMNYLLIPQKRPTYRKDRSHEDFLCKIKNFIPTKSAFINSVKKEISKNFTIEETTLEEARQALLYSHRKTTKKLCS